MTLAQPPAVSEFFASSLGVCVYVRVGGQSIRVEFESRDSVGTTRGVTSASAEQALRAATQTRDAQLEQLEPLFVRVEAERAARGAGY